MIINNFLYILANFPISFLIFLFILKFIKRIFPNFFLNRLIPNSLLISTILSLKDSSCSRYIEIITILRISSYNKFLYTLRTFHSKLINLSGMKVPNPSLHWIKSNTFSNHILTSLTSYVKWSLISNFTTTYSLTLNDNKGFCLYFFY